MTIEPHLGTSAVMALIINKMIGTGIFSTPSLIFALSGNIGTCLILWIFGGLITFCGLSVYLEFGLNIPLNGGEKNYLQRVWKYPKGLIDNVYAFQIVLLGFSTGNSYAFGKYFLFSIGYHDINEWIVRLFGIICISVCILIHIFGMNVSRNLFKIFGIIKILILMSIIFIGILSYLNLIKVEKNDNFDNIWENYLNYKGNLYNLSVSLLQIIYSFKGWENANYVLSEIKNPHKTLKIAAPLSVLITTVLYFLVILSYFYIIPKEEIKESGILIAGIFFKKIFGNISFLPILISISNFGNVLAVSFSHSRINQELSKENLIPFSKFFSNLKNSMLLHWFITVLILLIPPNYGNIYELVINLYSYPGTWINILVSIGLIYLKRNSKFEKWGMFNKSLDLNHQWNSNQLVNIIFLISNVFLALFPFIKPPNSFNNTDSYPYYLFPLTGVSVLFSGVVYWWFRHGSDELEPLLQEEIIN